MTNTDLGLITLHMYLDNIAGMISVSKMAEMAQQYANKHTSPELEKEAELAMVEKTFQDGTMTENYKILCYGSEEEEDKIKKFYPNLVKYLDIAFENIPEFEFGE